MHNALLIALFAFLGAAAAGCSAPVPCGCCAGAR